MKGTGYIKSKLDGKEIDLDKIVLKSSLPIPATLDYSNSVKALKKVKDQGSTSTCVCQSLGYCLECHENMLDLKSKFKLDIDKIYSIRADKKADGMQIKEALEYVKTKGYEVSKDPKKVHKIRKYGMLKSVEAIKRSLVVNGPCMFALPVYDTVNPEFWRGSKLIGGHAVACVGYDKKGFIIENSWGASWGAGGFVTLPYEDTSRLLEAWGIIA